MAASKAFSSRGYAHPFAAQPPTSSRIEKSETDVDDRHRHCRDAAPCRAPSHRRSRCPWRWRWRRGGGRGGGGFGGHGGGFGGGHIGGFGGRVGGFGGGHIGGGFSGRVGGVGGHIGGLGISGRGTGAGLGARSFGGSRIGAVGSGARPPVRQPCGRLGGAAQRNRQPICRHRPHLWTWQGRRAPP